MADIKYTMPPPTEDVEQMCLFRWADAQSGKYPELSLTFLPWVSTAFLPEYSGYAKRKSGLFRPLF